MANRFMFRAWDVINKKMYPVAFPTWNGATEGKYMMDNEELSPVETIDEDGDDKPIIMQCIGLSDENGKDIFELDIVEFDSINPDGDDCVETGVVHYSVEGEYILMYKNGSPDSLSAIGNDVMRVIGNIYETPELLTK